MKPWMPFQIQSVSSWEELRRFCSQGFQNIYAALNRKISFGDNIYCEIVDVQIGPTDTTIPHSLGVVPIGFLVLQLDTNLIIFNGQTAWTDRNIYLRASLGTANAKIAILGG